VPEFRVEIWVVTSKYLTVEADSAKAAEKKAERLLAEDSPRSLGAVYEDSWVDVMSAEPAERKDR
jgi:hypothetical protein